MSMLKTTLFLYNNRQLARKFTNRHTYKQMNWKELVYKHIKIKIEEPKRTSKQEDARRGMKSSLVSPTQQAFRTSKQIWARVRKNPSCRF
jgi:hypothetical protein